MYILGISGNLFSTFRNKDICLYSKLFAALSGSLLPKI